MIAVDCTRQTRAAHWWALLHQLQTRIGGVKRHHLRQLDELVPGTLNSTAANEQEKNERRKKKKKKKKEEEERRRGGGGGGRGNEPKTMNARIK